MEESYSLLAVLAFDWLNKFKYLDRCYSKHATPNEDIAKSEWYGKHYADNYKRLSWWHKFILHYFLKLPRPWN